MLSLSRTGEHTICGCYRPHICCLHTDSVHVIIYHVSTYLMVLFYPFRPWHCLAIVFVTQPQSLREEASHLREAGCLSTSPNNKYSSTS